jgi:hypothetical protein
MPEYIDPAALRADMRAKQERVDAISALAARKLGVRASRSRSSRSLDDLTAEEIERDTLSIRRILSVWRQIGKREPSPITLPSGRRLIPKSCATGASSRGIEYAVVRPHKKQRRGVRP